MKDYTDCGDCKQYTTNQIPGGFFAGRPSYYMPYPGCKLSLEVVLYSQTGCENFENKREIPHGEIVNS